MLKAAGDCKPRGSGYTATVLETTGTGFGDPIMMADDRRSAVFFTSVRLRAPFQWVGLGGETFGSAGAIVPVRQPRSAPAHPVWRRDAGLP